MRSLKPAQNQALIRFFYFAIALLSSRFLRVLRGK
jgi:hypothetical protein